MGSEELWIPIVLFLSIALVMGLWLYFRFRGRREFQETVRVAMDKGHELSPEFIENLGGEPKVGNADMRKGFIAVALGIGLASLVLSWVSRTR